jgi:Arc-like DNA binding domain
MTTNRVKRAREAFLNKALTAIHNETAKPEKDAQTSLRLPRAMYGALSEAAEEHGRGIGEEVRLRLESSFALELGEPDTRELAEAIMQAAQQIQQAYGSWRTDPFAFAVFNGAVSTLLAYYRPKGDPVPPTPEPGSLADTFFGPNASPETAGRTVAMAALAVGKKR